MHKSIEVSVKYASSTGTPPKLSATNRQKALDYLAQRPTQVEITKVFSPDGESANQFEQRISSQNMSLKYVPLDRPIKSGLPKPVSKSLDVLIGYLQQPNHIMTTNDKWQLLKDLLNKSPAN